MAGETRIARATRRADSALLVGDGDDAGPVADYGNVAAYAPARRLGLHRAAALPQRACST